MMLDAIPEAGTMLADKGYDADWFRSALKHRGIVPCIPLRSNRRMPLGCDPTQYRLRHKIENMFGRLKDWRRFHTRDDRCAHTFISAISIADAVAKADIVFLAFPYDAAASVIEAAGDLAGKVVVDLTNPMKADYSGLAIGFTTSAAEEIARLAPQAKVVKGFNTLFASVLKNGGKAAGTPATVLLAGDDAEAVAKVEALVKAAGLKAIIAGPLAAP